MPVVIAALWGALYSILGSLVGRVLLSLGLGVVTYSGISVTLNWLKSRFVESASALPADVLGMMATMKVGESVNIVFSAIVVRLVIGGLTSDTVKRWSIK